jgi:hypothetical protein
MLHHSRTRAVSQAEMESLNMAVRERLKVGNNVIEAEVHDEFADGYSNGYLYYYDTNHQLSHPLTTKSIHAFMTDNLFDKRAASQWTLVLCSDGLPPFVKMTSGFSLLVSSYLNSLLPPNLYP